MGSFKFEEDKVYMMPVFWGPNNFWYDDEGKSYQPATVETLALTFETSPQQIDALLPEQFTSNAPVINVQSSQFNYIGWCGGGSYNLLSITTPVHFKGNKDIADGDLILAMFENDPNQTLCGREMSGYNKPGCQLPKFTNFEGIYTSRAFAFETFFPFMTLRIDTNKEPENKERILELQRLSQGKMNYAYYPQVGDLTKARDQFVTLMPKEWQKPVDYKYELLERKDNWGTGTIEFYSPKTKMDMPIWFPVGKGLAALEIKGYLGACHSIWSEPCDYARTRILR